MNIIRLLLVDDEAAIRRGLRMRLELEPDMEVVGEAENGAAALEQARRLAPAVVLMDVQMPGMNGIDATREMRAQAPRTAVVVLSMFDDAETQSRARDAGASAFVAKQGIDSSLLEAIRHAAERPEEVP